MSFQPVSILQTELASRHHRLEQALRKNPGQEQLQRLLAEVDAALLRIEQGCYGLCEICHEPVEAPKLLADPLLRYCEDHLPPAAQQALLRDLELSSRVQAGLLPPRPWQDESWEADYLYRPAGAVSGDYLDLIPCRSGSFFFALGDVSGKGIAASLLMTHLNALFRTLAPLGLPVTGKLEQAGRIFCESTLPNYFATLICGQAEPGGRIELANAGHLPAMLRQSGRWKELDATSLPLGLFCSGEFPTWEIRLDPGDLLILYSDGLSEAENPQGKPLGRPGLLDILTRAEGSRFDELVHLCLAGLDDFQGGAPAGDDQSLLAIRRR